MKILVDTPVWSKAFRKSTDAQTADVLELKELIREMRVVMIGPIRQELLSGISNYRQYQALLEKLRAFDDLSLNSEYYEYAAHLSNTCRKKGIQGSHTDFLICSVAMKNNLLIYTLDYDFRQYKKYIKIKMYQARKKTK